MVHDKLSHSEPLVIIQNLDTDEQLNHTRRTIILQLQLILQKALLFQLFFPAS